MSPTGTESAPAFRHVPHLFRTDEDEAPLPVKNQRVLMADEPCSIPTTESAPRPTDRGYSLSHRATLTFISNMLSQGALLFVGFVVTPVLTHGLGDVLYGAWVMIQRTVGYLALGDLQPMSTLKFTLAVTQHIEDAEHKRRQLGAAIVLWMASLPLMFALGGAAIWAAPWFIQVEPGQEWMIRVAMAFVVVGVVLSRIVSLPGNVLRGTNQEYKRMGVSSVAVLLTGLITLPAVWLGWSLPGVAAASIAGTILMGVVQYWIARQAVSWLGWARPTLKEFLHFAGVSLWLALSALSYLFLNATDVLIIGYLLGPASVAVYALTGAVMRFASGPLIHLLTSGNAGIAGLCGAHEWRRVARLRSEMYLLTITVVGILATGVVALNGPFVGLWVGNSLFGGYLVNLALVAAAAAAVLIRVDGTILDAVLAFRVRTIATAVAGLVLVAGGTMLCSTAGILGMAIALFSSQVGLAIFQDVYVSRYLRCQGGEGIESNHHWRPLLVAVAFVAAAAAAAPRIAVTNWLVFFAEAAAVGLITTGAFWSVGLDSSQRHLLTHRIRAFYRRPRQSTPAPVYEDSP